MNPDLKKHVASLLASLDNLKAVLLLMEGQYAVLYPMERGGSVAFKLISPEAVRTAFSRLPIDTGWLPADVRRWGHTPAGEYAVMFIPARRHVVPLANTWGNRFPAKRLLKVEVPLPAMVFAGLGQSYYVWACAEAPHPGAALFEAPLPNVSRGGGICFGRNHPPQVKPSTMAQAWKLFMTSPFNDHLRGGSSKAHPDDVREQLLAVAASGADTYPTADLVPLQGTVTQAIQQLLNSGGRV
jgi:PRTRC genetic system protein B